MLTTWLSLWREKTEVDNELFRETETRNKIPRRHHCNIKKIYNIVIVYGFDHVVYIDLQN